MVSTWVRPACHSCDFWALRDKPLPPPRCASLGRGWVGPPSVSGLDATP